VLREIEPGYNTWTDWAIFLFYFVR